MNRSMTNIVVIAQKEIADARKNNLFIFILLLLLLLVVTSEVVASFDFQYKLDQYQQAIEVLEKLGKHPDTSTPQFFPLKILRGVTNYLEIIGAILGIVLGYLSIAKEKGRNTLQLLLSRPVSRLDIGAGKAAGNSVLIVSALVMTAVASYAITWLLGGMRFSSAEMLKYCLMLASAYFYIMFFFFLAAYLAVKMRTLSNALIVSFVIWLGFVLIIPQIGDTMDPDNQIPGGFFKHMHIEKAEGKIILEKFHIYETLRNGLEECSVTKHFERLSFALLGIKDEYNNQSLKVIFADKWKDGAWILLFFSLMMFAEFRTIILMTKK